MNKEQIEMKRANIIEYLNAGMYNTALKQLKELVDNMTVADINENEDVCYYDQE